MVATYENKLNFISVENKLNFISVFHLANGNVILQLILFNPGTGQSQCIQNVDSIILTLDGDNDDVNIVPFLPLDILLHLLIRGAGQIIPRMVITPSLSEIMKIRPIKMELLYELYNRRTFMHFAYNRQEAACNYGRKMVLKGSLNEFRPLFYRDIELYFQMAQNLLVECESICVPTRNIDHGQKMYKTENLDPILPTTRRQIWHETVAESDFIHFCKTDTRRYNPDWSGRKIIDCRGAIREWKEVQNSKKLQSEPSHIPINGFKSSTSKDEWELVTDYIKKIELDDVGDKLISIFEQDLLQQVLDNIGKLRQLQAEKKMFLTLDSDTNILSKRCLPLLNQALKINPTALRIKEYRDSAAQAEYWETEWCDEWSNASTQTMEN